MFVKPPVGATISSHPIADDIVFAALPGLDFPYEIISKGVFSLNTNATKTGIYTKHGSGVSSTNVATGGLYYPWCPRLTEITNRCSIVIWANITALDTSGKLISLPFRSDATWTSPWCALAFDRSSSTSSMRLNYADSGGTGYVATSDTGMIDTGSGFSQYVFTWEGADVIFYKNGRQFGAAKTITNGNVGWTGVNVNLLNRNTLTQDEGFSGQIASAVIWKRALEPTEVSLLYAYPYIWASTTNETFDNEPEKCIPKRKNFKISINRSLLTR